MLNNAESIRVTDSEITTVDLSHDENNPALVIIDQTKLPREFVLLALTETEEIYEAIKSLRVRGAPAIGVSAALGLYAVTARYALSHPACGKEEFAARFEENAARLASSRPTAVNLFWAIDKMRAAFDSVRNCEIPQILAKLREVSLGIRSEDIGMCRKIGEYGAVLFKDGDGILTHCNAGELAAVKYGTALAPIYVGTEQGCIFHVYSDETRPLLQGARLTSYELHRHGIDVTVICDNMASSVMSQGKINAVIVGADRITANGDVCNKIGTSGVAILAKHYGIPFYVAAPYSTFDHKTKDGSGIVIEQRSGDEISTMHYASPKTPEGVNFYNPAFDVTPAALVSAIITERGIIYAPDTEKIEAFRRDHE